jgi:hypothetical protein
VTRSCVHDELHVVGRGRRRGHRVDRSRLCGHSVDRSRCCVTRSCVHRELHLGDRSLRRGTLGCVPRILARRTLDPYGGGFASVRWPDGFRTSAGHGVAATRTAQHRAGARAALESTSSTLSPHHALRPGRAHPPCKQGFSPQPVSHSRARTGTPRRIAPLEDIVPRRFSQQMLPPCEGRQPPRVRDP